MNSLVGSGMEPQTPMVLVHIRLKIKVLVLYIIYDISLFPYNLSKICLVQRDLKNLGYTSSDETFLREHF